MCPTVVGVSVTDDGQTKRAVSLLNAVLCSFCTRTRKRPSHSSTPFCVAFVQGPENGLLTRKPPSHTSPPFCVAFVLRTRKRPSHYSPPFCVAFVLGPENGLLTRKPPSHTSPPICVAFVLVLVGPENGHLTPPMPICAIRRNYQSYCKAVFYVLYLAFEANQYFRNDDE